MTYRGRLIQVFMLIVERLDTDATGTNPGLGYDDVFGAPKLEDDGSQLGAPSEKFHPQDSIPCQVDRNVWGQEEMSGGGGEQATEAVFTLHFKDLERLGLVRADGSPRFSIGDKIVELRRKSGALVRSWADKPLYVTQVEDAGMGIDIGAPTRNLLYLHAQFRRKGEAARR